MEENLTLHSPQIQENLDEIHMGLRENPKKSWWVSSIPMEQSNFCENCGKGFKSNKALFGHMRLHSKRKSIAVKKIIDLPKPTKKKRSERRYSKINSCSNNSSLSNLNPSSSSMTVSFDCVDQELEEIAVCLLMLGNGGFCSFYAPVVDKPFSDEDEDDSVKMGPSFPVESAQIANVVHDNVIEVLNSCDLGCGYVSFKGDVTEFCGFDRGFSKSTQENLGPGPSFACLKKPGFDVQTESQAELHNGVHDNVIGVLNSCDLGCGYVSVKEEVTEYCGLNRGFSKSNQENLDPGPSFGCLKKPGFDVRTENQAELHGIVIKDQQFEPVWGFEIENRAELYDTTKIKDEKNDSIEELPLKQDNHKKYICKICNKSFKSGQSLGGHKLHCPTSKRHRSSISLSGACFETSIKTEVLIHEQKSESSPVELQGSENRVEKLGSDKKKKRGKKHKCPHCCKSFGSGQALGGHMRAHVNGKLDSIETRT